MKNDKNHDSSRNYAFIPIGHKVAVQQDDDRLWTHGKVIGRRP